MTCKEDVKGALAEMDYEIVDNGHIELPLSTPATLEFVSDATLDVEAFEDELDERGFGMLTPHCKEPDEDGAFYCDAKVEVPVPSFDGDEPGHCPSCGRMVDFDYWEGPVMTRG